MKLRLHPTSCRCGGSWAWVRVLFDEDDCYTYEMVGCACHRPQEVRLHRLDVPSNIVLGVN